MLTIVADDVGRHDFLYANFFMNVDVLADGQLTIPGAEVPQRRLDGAASRNGSCHRAIGVPGRNL